MRSRRASACSSCSRASARRPTAGASRAQGIADFQRVVAQGIDERLLRWKGIEATQKLAELHNTKIVIVGAGKDGLPVILGGQ